MSSDSSAPGPRGKDDKAPLRVIATPPGAPFPVGPYSAGIEAGGWLFLSGQIALTLEGSVIKGGIEAESGLIFERIDALLASAGYTPGDVVKVILYLTDMAFFSKVNDACARFFQEPYPARVTVGVASLPKGAQLEIELVAFRHRS